MDSKKKISKKLQKSKGFKHQSDVEIKKKLKSFALKEFKTKKPLELRILKLKPKVVFKKGTVLPNLLIKSLQNTAYVIYLDYGNDIRFYFYSILGITMGASSFQKNDKILKEMHGKAITLLKLPKKNRNEGIDIQSIELQKKFHKISEQISNKYNISSNKFKLPSISVKKYIKPNTYISARLGISQNGKLYHFNKKFLTENFEDFILKRELFPIYLKMDVKDEITQIIATIWAVSEISRHNRKDFSKIKNKILVNKKISLKTFEWIDKNFIFGKKIEKTEDYDNFARFLFDSISFIFKFDHLINSGIWKVFSLWILKYGINKYSKFNSIKESLLKQSWICNEVINFYLTEYSLICKYDLNNEFMINKLNLKNWVLYLSSHYILKSNDLIEWDKLPKKTKIHKDELNNKIQEKLIQNLQNLLISEFINILPLEIRSEMSKTLNNLLYEVFLNKGLDIDAPKEVPLKTNENKTIEITLINKTDWILYEVKYFLSWDPNSKLDVKIINRPRTSIFDTKIHISINLSAKKSTGNCNLSLKCQFEDKLTKNNFQIISLLKISVEII